MDWELASDARTMNHATLQITLSLVKLTYVAINGANQEISPYTIHNTNLHPQRDSKEEDSNLASKLVARRIEGV